MGKADFKSEYTIRFCVKSCLKEYEMLPTSDNLKTLDFYSTEESLTYKCMIKLWLIENLLILIGLFTLWLVCFLKIR